MTEQKTDDTGIGQEFHEQGFTSVIKIGEAPSTSDFIFAPKGEVAFIQEDPSIHRPVKWDELLFEDAAQDSLEAKYKSVTFESRWIPQIKRQTDIIIENRSTYEDIERKTSVPWWVVGILHMRESGFSFNGWLANGDSLTGPTWRVPAGLRCPGNPPWRWADAAVVSLNHQNGTRKPELKSLGVALDYIERYNGLGYRTGAGRNTTPPSSSPYIWSGTTGYQRGKYVADGQFSATAVDAQLGAACIMKELQSRGIDLGLGENPKRDVDPVSPTWWEIFRLQDGGNAVIGWAGDRAVFRKDTIIFDDLVSLRKKYPTAGTFRTAPAGKALPGIGPGPEPVPGPTPDKPDSKVLDVPYFYQYNNRNEPAATCGLTSAAMLLKYKGKQVTPDGLYLQYGKPQGQSPGNLAQLYQWFGLKSTHTRSGTYQDMRDAIDAGSPVILHGYFTAGGHIVCVVGYQKGSFIINDPAGEWSGVKGSGYNGRPEDGKKVIYSINELVSACGRDGELWLSYTV